MRTQYRASRGARLGVAVLLAGTAISSSAASALAKSAPAKHGPVTRAEVIALIKRYAPAAKAGATGAAGASGPAGPVGATGAAGPAGPVGASGPVGPAGATGPVGATGAAGAAAPTYSAGGGLLQVGDTFELDPSSTIFQDPLTRNCAAGEFLLGFSQIGYPTCDAAVTADVKDVSPNGSTLISTSPVVPVSIATLAPTTYGPYWISGTTTLINGGTASAEVDCTLTQNQTVYDDGSVTIAGDVGYASVSLSGAGDLETASDAGDLSLECSTSAPDVRTLNSGPSSTLTAIALSQGSVITTSKTN